MDRIEAIMLHDEEEDEEIGMVKCEIDNMSSGMKWFLFVIIILVVIPLITLGFFVKASREHRQVVIDLKEDKYPKNVLLTNYNLTRYWHFMIITAFVSRNVDYNPLNTSIDANAKIDCDFTAELPNNRNQTFSKHDINAQFSVQSGYHTSGEQFIISFFNVSNINRLLFDFTIKSLDHNFTSINLNTCSMDEKAGQLQFMLSIALGALGLILSLVYTLNTRHVEEAIPIESRLLRTVFVLIPFSSGIIEWIFPSLNLTPFIILDQCMAASLNGINKICIYFCSKGYQWENNQLSGLNVAFFFLLILIDSLKGAIRGILMLDDPFGRNRIAQFIAETASFAFLILWIIVSIHKFARTRFYMFYFVTFMSIQVLGSIVDGILGLYRKTLFHSIYSQFLPIIFVLFNQEFSRPLKRQTASLGSL